MDTDTIIIIPDYDPEDPKPYPGGIKPGHYTINEFVQLLRDHSHDPAAVHFLADMLEV